MQFWSAYKKKMSPALYQSCFITMEDVVRLQYALAMAFVDHHVQVVNISRCSLPPANPLPVVWPRSLLSGSVETSLLTAQTMSDFVRD